MAREIWSEQLEAYLDGELDPRAAQAFEAETAADPELSRMLEERRSFRQDARHALGGDMPAELAPLARAMGRPVNRRRTGRRWPLLAAAATLAVAVLAPTLLRNIHGAAGPRSTITRSGQVVAIRFGETPGGTVVLEPGRLQSTMEVTP